MTLQEAIKVRHSVRQYLDKPIEAEKIAQLSALIDECNRKAGLHMQLVTNEPKAFAEGMAKYGKFSGISNYVAMVCKKGDDTALGYYGEQVVLLAQTLGLNTCWVAGTFGRGKCKANAAAGEKLLCVISLGYGENQGAVHKSKPVEKLCDIPEAQQPDWFKEGLEAALLAPTALNQQKFLVSLKDGEPVITTKGGPMTQIDLGIVKYNFEAASGHKCK